MGQKVAILGASSKKDRYSYKAFQMLQDYGHTPLPVSPKLQELEGIKAYANIKDVPAGVDTLTMYVGPETSTKLQTDILNLKPKRVIFNPGSENVELEKALEEAGVHVIEACTLVLLRTEQFDKA
jgi:predicted CoA-binding protein